MPKKKKKGVDKEKKARKKTCLNERETVSYEQQILDNNKQLARLRSRNEQLEAEADASKAKLRQLEDDRSDAVAHLKRVLRDKSEEARELNDRLSAMEELRREEQLAYKKKEDAMQSEYRAMENNLSAEVKLAAGKLNALEDWRLARIDLMRKFEIQEEQMAEQEEKHKNTLYRVEKSLVIGKAKMQKEMEERLNELAESFRKATNIRVADATHRAVRENVALNLELDAMYGMFRELDLRLKGHKEEERNLRVESALFRAEAGMLLKKLYRQNSLMDESARAHRDAKVLHGKICREEITREMKERIVETCGDGSDEAQRRARVLEQNIQIIEKDTESVLGEWRNDCREDRSIANLFDEAKRYVMDIARHQETNFVEGPCNPCRSWLEKKLRVLMDILERRQSFKASESNDFTTLEAEFSSDKLYSVSLRDDSPIEQIQDIATEWNVPKRLSTESQSSDVTSPRETETPGASLSDTALSNIFGNDRA